MFWARRILLGVTVTITAGGVVAFLSLAVARGDSLTSAASQHAADVWERGGLIWAVVAACVGWAGAWGLERFGLPRARRAPRLEIASASAVSGGRVSQAELAEIASRLRATLGTDDPKMGAFVDTLVHGAIATRASDVHIHPLEKGTRISFRIDGVLRDLATLDRSLHARLLMRLKVVAGLVTYRSNEPQDGHFSVPTPDGDAELRVSLLPTNHGETAVLRVAGVELALPTLTSLGFPESLMRRYQELLESSQGLVFLTGPTGSGKTTTIYASLGHIVATRGETTHIATIEDPIEFNVPTLSQTQVNPEVGLTFAKGLRSLLRQDPNVLMVGEIRDRETAAIASQAGLTGHLILTTIHADSAAGVFNRLIEMGVEPFVVASASLATLNQRLVRRLCDACKQPGAPSDEERGRFERGGLSLGGEPFFVPRGCGACGDSGYAGRLPIFELLVVTPSLRDLITEKVPTGRIHEAAAKEGMVPLLAAGLDQARAGSTTLAEAIRIAG